MATVIRLGGPRMGRMALNLAGAMMRTGGAALAGQPVRAPEEVQTERLAVCAACSDFIPDENRCGLCGCKTKGWVLNKIKWATERCPASPPKWGPWTG